MIFTVNLYYRTGQWNWAVYLPDDEETAVKMGHAETRTQAEEDAAAGARQYEREQMPAISYTLDTHDA